jgi:tagatose 1,6-diphosphate aldolase GatY/KbaY
MPFVSENELLEQAERRGYAVPGFFPFNLDFIKPIIEVAEEENAPVIMLQGPEFIKSFGEHVFTQALITAAHYAKVPVSIAMDHGFVTGDETIKQALRAIHLGWKSVMFDGSLLPYEENVCKTKEVAKICQGAGVSCLGALGEVKRFFPQAMNYSNAFTDGFTIPSEIMTDPVQAAEFVDETKVDSLAVSVGQYVRSLWDGEQPPFKRTARLDLKRLETIRKNVKAHFVLHGSTHVHEDDLRESIKCGVSMIKVASEQAILWSMEIRKLVIENRTVMFPEDIQRPALAAVKESMRYYIRLFNASNQL